MKGVLTSMVIEVGEEEIKRFQKETNWDYVKALSAEEFAEAFWSILDIIRDYTDSRISLKMWLNSKQIDQTLFCRFKVKK